MPYKRTPGAPVGYTPNPFNLGMAAWTVDPAGNSAGTAIGAATHYVSKIFVSGTQTVTNVLAGTSVAATTAANSYFALYDSSGNLITGTQTADISASWNAAAGLKSSALGAAAVVANDFVYLSMWVNSAGALPTVLRAGSSAIVNMGTTSGVVAGATSPRSGTAANGYTSSGTVAPATLGVITVNNNAWVFGLS